MKKISLKNLVWKEGKYYVSQTLNMEVSSFGKTRKEAVKNLIEAVSLYLENSPKAEVRKIRNPSIITNIVSYAQAPLVNLYRKSPSEEGLLLKGTLTQSAVSQKGSHAKFHKLMGGKTLVVIVPMGNKEIPHGTFHSILRQSGMKKDEFS